MMSLFTEKAPKPIGPYSQAVMAGDFLFLSGQIGLDPNTGKLREGFREQVEQIFENIEAVLNSAGLEKKHMVRVVVYMKDLALFKEFNQLYEEFLKDVEIKPSRTTVGVSELPMGALLELEVTAFLERGNNL
ncbi:MAG: Rid family detoxifying hydrolase [Aquificaceae bacterium]|nr:Rid family detoxifying hydrolase [Aquificaceae bacterium]